MDYARYNGKNNRPRAFADVGIRRAVDTYIYGRVSADFIAEYTYAYAQRAYDR